MNTSERLAECPPVFEGRRVLVVGINFRPEDAGIAPYTAEMVDHLLAEGAEVEVWTGVAHYPSWRVAADQRLLFRSQEIDAGMTLRRLRHFVPRRQTAVRRGLYEATFAMQVMLTRWRQRPDIIICIIPSLLSAAWMTLIGRWRRVAVALWVQDLMAAGAEESGMPGGKRVAGPVKRIERVALKNATKVVVISDPFRNYVRGVRGTDSGLERVRNWSHIERFLGDRGSERERLGWMAHEYVVLHAGNVGLKQGLESVVAAGRICESQQLPYRFVIMGNGSQRAKIERLARGLRCVTLLEPVAQERFPAVLAAADALLVNERPGLREMSLPSKLTSYLVAGRPIVAAVEPEGGTAREVLRSGAGVLVGAGDPEALVGAAKRLSGEPGAAVAMGGQGEAYAQRHLSRRRSLRKIDAILASGLSGSSASGI